MSFARAVARPAQRSLKNASSARPLVARVAQTSQRFYSSSSGSNANGKSKAVPYAFGLLGLGSVGGYFGLSEKKDPATTQDGMSKQGGKVDYQQVYNDIAEGWCHVSAAALVRPISSYRYRDWPWRAAT
jgi:hypothetical protein